VRCEEDEDYNIDLAAELLDGYKLHDLFDAAGQKKTTDDDEGWDAWQRHREVLDDILIAFDQLGWTVGCKTQPDKRWPMWSPHPLTPSWADTPESDKPKRPTLRLVKSDDKPEPDKS
jgi:hypothetical protein